MTDNGKMVESPDMGALLLEKGPEFLIASEMPRLWATGAQAFVNASFTMLIFREQTVMQPSEGTPHLTLRNVASLALPTEVVREFHKVLTRQLEMLDATEGE